MSKTITSILAALVITLGLFVTKSSATQDSYRYEIVGQWLNSESDNYESDIYVAQALVSFAPVVTTNRPLAEALFLERCGAVQFFTGAGDHDSSSTSMIQYSADEEIYGFDVMFTKPDIPVLFEAGYEKSDTDYSTNINYNVSSDGYHIAAGYYPLDSLLTRISYEKSEKDYSIGGIDSEDQTIGLNGKYVALLGDGTALNFEVGVDFMEHDSSNTPGVRDSRLISFGGDYYFNNSLSLGGSLGFYRGDTGTQEGELYTVKGALFVTKQFGIDLRYNRFEADEDSADDSDAFSVSVIGLF